MGKPVCQQLNKPVPCRGSLGLWRLPEDVEAAVRAQLDAQGECATDVREAMASELAGKEASGG